MSTLNTTIFDVFAKYNGKFNSEMPRSRKRHHSRSKSKSRSKSPSRDRSYERQKKPISNEKDGKRRRLDDAIDSPVQKSSVSSDEVKMVGEERVQEVAEQTTNEEAVQSTSEEDVQVAESMSVDVSDSETDAASKTELADGSDAKKESSNSDENTRGADVLDSIQIEVIYDKKEKLSTPKKPLTPKQLQIRIESAKKKQLKQKEREEREKQRLEEKAKLNAEKQKLKEQKEAERLKQLEAKQKEKEMKEEQKKKEREEKEQKRKEKEEQEAQKRKEKEQERLKKIQEIEEKNKEKQKEEEKKLKSVTLFKSFFKKTEGDEKESKPEKVSSNFMPFEVKSDMRLPPLRRAPLSSDQIHTIDKFLSQQDYNISYLKELKSAKIKPGKSSKTWPYEDPEEEVTIIEEDKDLGEKIFEDQRVGQKMKAKFLHFHENRRPAYFGTWRKRSKFITARRPFAEDNDIVNYEEDSDDDWEEEEQGESLDVSGDEDEKDTENDEDDYEVDNEFFVPHGHLSDDEIDDEENARLSPESLKQKLKLLKDEFDEDIKSKTHKLKPRSIGCIWLNKNGDNVDDAIYRYLLPFAMLIDIPKEIKKRADIFASPVDKKKVKSAVELPVEHIPFFLKLIHGNVQNQKLVVEEFITFMGNNGYTVEVSKAYLLKFLKQSATYKKCKENGPLKNKFGWFLNDDIKIKFNI